MEKSDNYFTGNSGRPPVFSVSIHLILDRNLGDSDSSCSLPSHPSQLYLQNISPFFLPSLSLFPTSHPGHGGCSKDYWKVSSSPLCSSRVPICPCHSPVWNLTGPSCCFWDESMTFPWSTGPDSGRALPTPQPSTESWAPTTVAFFLVLEWAKFPLSAMLFFPKLPPFSLYYWDLTQVSIILSSNPLVSKASSLHLPIKRCPNASEHISVYNFTSIPFIIYWTFISPPH